MWYIVIWYIVIINSHYSRELKLANKYQKNKSHFFVEFDVLVVLSRVQQNLRKLDHPTTYVFNPVLFLFRYKSTRPQQQSWWSFISHLPCGHLLFRSWQAVVAQLHIQVQSDCSRGPTEAIPARMLECFPLRRSFKKVKNWINLFFLYSLKMTSLSTLSYWKSTVMN